MGFCRRAARRSDPQRVRFVSTRGAAPGVSFREALFAGLSPDAGLYVPETLGAIDFEALRGASLVDIGTAIVAHFAGDELPRPAIARLLTDALDFPIPLLPLDDRVSVLELFHGPTFAFKDVGARVMARLMAHFNDDRQPITVLVATSGDTGSAVAQAFYGLAGTRVMVLFPDGAVTPVQEAQFATLGGNVTAVAVAGTFDDCQRLTKEAFADQTLSQRARLTSANSINVGRLLPQMFYYAQAALQYVEPPAISVPSGNFGNLTAGLFAWKMGAPIARFVAATTINDTLPRYLETGQYQARPSVVTLANAMDVGNPSNVERMRWLFNDDVSAMREMITPSVHTDSDVRRTIRDVWNRHGYVCDPHTAIAYLGLSSLTGERARPGTAAGGLPGRPGSARGDGGVGGHRAVFLATAHPAKFRETVEPALGLEVPLPPPLAAALTRPRLVERIEPTLTALRAVL
jgi:threonine synthase